MNVILFFFYKVGQKVSLFIVSILLSTTNKLS